MAACSVRLEPGAPRPCGTARVCARGPPGSFPSLLHRRRSRLRASGEEHARRVGLRAMAHSGLARDVLRALLAPG
eukprot:14742638-Alexandrium_andersonii.AAC.1